MALQALLQISSSRKKIGISKERVESIIPEMRKWVSFWRAYPDLFVDFMQTGGDETKEKRLKFFFYQRVFLRVAARYKYVYAVYPREICAGNNSNII